MLHQVIIKSSISPWYFPDRVDPKKFDSSSKQKWKVAIDCRELNESTVGEKYPLSMKSDL